MFCKKCVLRNFAKFTGKHLCQNLLFNKVAGQRLATLLKKGLWNRCFPVNFVKFLRTPFLIEHLWWLLLSWQKKVGKFYRCKNMNNLLKLFVNIHVYEKAKREYKIKIVTEMIIFLGSVFQVEHLFPANLVLVIAH